MWLAYLRFDFGNDTRIALVRCYNGEETELVVSTAKRTFGEALTEYATFYSGRTIHPKAVPNSSESLIGSTASFMQACGYSFVGDKWQQRGTATQSPGSGRDLSRLTV